MKAATGANGQCRILVLADNHAAGRGLRGEHGLAFRVECGGTVVLFDTGQGLVLRENARALGVDLAAVRSVALSHGHYDHTGGLAAVLAAASGPVTVYGHPEVMRERWSLSGGAAHPVGLPSESRRALAGDRVRLAWSAAPVALGPGIWLTGQIPRIHPEEAWSGPFFYDAAGTQPDAIPDDQALYIETAAGVVVVLGCAHAGVINTLDYIGERTKGQPVRAVIGGTHLGAADAERLAWTIARLRSFGIRRLAPMHCSGQTGFARLQAAFPTTCVSAGAGSLFTFNQAD